jgi:antitoxin HicB
MANKTLDYYLGLPYTIEVIKDAGDEYSGLFARVVELPGCMTQADNFEELGEMIEDAMRAWIEAMLEAGRSIPEPQAVESYSGKFIVRLPRSLHRELVQLAEREGVSLNMYVAAALGKAVGQANLEKQLPIREGLEVTTPAKIAAKNTLVGNILRPALHEKPEDYDPTGYKPT